MPDKLENLKQKLFSKIQLYPVEIKKIDDIDQMLFKNSNLENLDNISMEDLIDRSPIKPNRYLLNNDIKNKIIFVSGGGGSIGSELCRQIIQLSPKIVYF